MLAWHLPLLLKIENAARFSSCQLQEGRPVFVDIFL